MKLTAFGGPGGLPLCSTAALAAAAGALPLGAADAASPPALPRLKVSGNGRFLVTEKGKPFFWLGDTAWWIRNIGPEDVDYYLSHRARQGFNVIQVHPGFSAKDYAGRAPFLDGDTATPNEPFWQNMDDVVAKARRHGLYVALVPMWGEEYGRAFGADAEKAHRVGRWIGKRYAVWSHVLWIASGEYDAINGFRVPISAEQKGVILAAARGIHEATGGGQLMTIHPGVALTSSLDFHREPWLSFNMLQSGHMIDSAAYNVPENHALIARDYALTPTRPVLDGEPAYEDTPDGVWVYRDTNRPRVDAAAVRRKAYWAVFSGAFGHTYGHNDVYGFYQPAHPGEVQTLPDGPGNRGHWRASLDAPGATQMKHLRALMESRPFLDRIPDQSLVVKGPQGSLDHIAATRAADGSYAMLYFPMGKPAAVALTKLSGRKVKAWWFDPRTGIAKAAGEFDRRGDLEFTPPSGGAGQDWALVVDDASRRFGAPGGGATAS